MILALLVQFLHLTSLQQLKSMKKLSQPFLAWQNSSPNSRLNWGCHLKIWNVNADFTGLFPKIMSKPWIFAGPLLWQAIWSKAKHTVAKPWKQSENCWGFIILFLKQFVHVLFWPRFQEGFLQGQTCKPISRKVLDHNPMSTYLKIKLTYYMMGFQDNPNLNNLKLDYSYILWASHEYLVLTGQNFSQPTSQAPLSFSSCRASISKLMAPFSRCLVRVTATVKSCNSWSSGVEETKKR